MSGEPFALAVIISLTQELCLEFFTSKINSLLANKSSCVLSNVPGPNDILAVREAAESKTSHSGLHRGIILGSGCPYLLMEDKSLLESKGMRLFYQILN